MLEQRGSANGDERVMIIGAGNAGRMLIRELIMSSTSAHEGLLYHR